MPDFGNEGNLIRALVARVWELVVKKANSKIILRLYTTDNFEKNINVMTFLL